jgi:hypothetical protein
MRRLTGAIRTTMPARATERNLPPGLTAADLGQAQGDASATLVSYHSSPCAVGRSQTYVVFVLDAALQGTVERYRWTVGTANTETTEGVFEHTPAAAGNLRVDVSLLDAGSAVLKTLSITQGVVALHPELEFLISRPDEVSAVADDPETSREIVNDVRVYIDELAPRSADPDSSLNKLLFAIGYAEAMSVRPADRSIKTQALATALAASEMQSFADQAKDGIGLCQVRPQILAMYVSATAGGTAPMLPLREFPKDVAAREPIATALLEEFVALDPAQKIDLFNLLRFPKANLRMAMQFVDKLMTQYFPGEPLPAILADADKAQTLISQYKEGPFALT